MARQTVGTIMSNIAATVNQDPTQPVDGSPDWNLWLQYINRAQIEWAESFDWEVLKKTYGAPITSSAASGFPYSIPLPLDWRKVAGPVVNWSTGISGGETWPEILPERQQEYRTSDKWMYVGGDPSGGYSMYWNPGTLVSGASVTVPYYFMPTSLTSSTQYPLMPDSEFLVNRTIAYVLEARSDPRYQDQERKARERLLNMVDNASVAKYNSYINPIKIETPESRANFRIGRN